MKTIISAVALALIAAAALASTGAGAGDHEGQNPIGACTGCQAAWGSHD